MTPDEALESYYRLCRNLIKGGWTINAVEEADFETLIAVLCGSGAKTRKVDLMDYMKQERGLTER